MTPEGRVAAELSAIATGLAGGDAAAAPPAEVATYVWEPTTDSIAARYGLPRESIVRFDVNTSPVPPDLADVLAGELDPCLYEYPPSDYAPLVAAAAAAYGVGRDEILPTGGLARSCGALSTEDFGKFVQVQRISRSGLTAIRESVESIAEAEGLIAHKRAVEVRFEAGS